MALKINFNAEAAVTHTALLRNERAMNKSLLRISTGNRILSAADDAAGLFIADQLNVVAAALDQGNRNIQTGISALQIAETNVGQIFEKLQTIYTKAQSAANDINDPNARAAIQRDITNLRDAIQKIATDTEYNGIRLLDGTFQGKVIHYGARANQTITVDIGNLQTTALGSYLASSSGNVATGSVGTTGGTLANFITGLNSPNYVATSGENVDINGNIVFQGTAAGILVDAATLADGVNSNPTLQNAGIRAIASNSSLASTYTAPVSVSGEAGGASDGDNAAFAVTLNFYLGTGNKTFSVNLSQINITYVDDGTNPAYYTTVTNTATLDTLVQRINSAAGLAGASVVAVNDNGKLKLTTPDGQTIGVEARVIRTADSGGDITANISVDFAQILQGASSRTFNNVDATAQYAQAVKVGSVNITAPEAYTLNYSSGVSAFNFAISSGTQVGLQSLESISVLSNEDAEKALLIINTAIQKVDKIRTQIGSVINNLQAIWDGQKASYDNTKEAENVIRNTDFAAEMTTFTTMQIRMQAGVAMLAQANALPQLVLQLLR